MLGMLTWVTPGKRTHPLDRRFDEVSLKPLLMEQQFYILLSSAIKLYWLGVLTKQKYFFHSESNNVMELLVAGSFDGRKYE